MVRSDKVSSHLRCQTGEVIDGHIRSGQERSHEVNLHEMKSDPVK
jgi:hypothetical protein